MNSATQGDIYYDEEEEDEDTFEFDSSFLWLD
jgi:hypothetical protein